jgi:hypothetical protein
MSACQRLFYIHEEYAGNPVKLTAGDKVTFIRIKGLLLHLKDAVVYYSNSL